MNIESKRGLLKKFLYPTLSDLLIALMILLASSFSLRGICFFMNAAISFSSSSHTSRFLNSGSNSISA